MPLVCQNNQGVQMCMSILAVFRQSFRICQTKICQNNLRVRICLPIKSKLYQSFRIVAYGRRKQSDTSNIYAYVTVLAAEFSCFDKLFYQLLLLSASGLFYSFNFLLYLSLVVVALTFFLN